MFKFLFKKSKQEEQYDKGKQKNSLLTKQPSMSSHIVRRWNLKSVYTHSKEEPIYKEILINLKRKVIPIDLEDHHVVGYNRYKGDIWGVYQNSHSHGIFFFINNPVNLEISIVKRHSPEKPSSLLLDEIRHDFDLIIKSSKDEKYISHMITTMIQRTLAEMQSHMREGDFITVNRTGIFMGFHEELEPIVADKAVMLLLDMSHDLGLIKKGD